MRVINIDLLMEMKRNNTIHSDLFKTKDGNEFSFVVHDCLDRNLVVQLIQAGGGRVDAIVGDHSITLAPPLVAAFADGRELFGYDFVFLSCISNSLQDLNSFRLELPRCNPNKYNAMSILQRKVAWKDIMLVKETESSVVSPTQIFDTEGALVKAIKPDLFKCFNGVPFSFNLLESVLNQDKVVKMIQAGGGELVDEAGPHTISLISPVMAAFYSETEVFAFDFIYRSCVKDKVEDLNKFRIGMSIFKKYNATDVLYQLIAWQELSVQENSMEEESETDAEIDIFRSPPPKALQSSVVAATPTTSSEGTRTDSPSDCETQYKKEKLEKALRILQEKSNRIAQSGVRSTGASKVKHVYTSDDRRKIIDYIVEHNSFSKVKGVVFWQRFERSGVMGSLTWQSLKNHYIRTILPQIKLYGLPDQIVKRFLQR